MIKTPLTFSLQSTTPTAMKSEVFWLNLILALCVSPSFAQSAKDDCVYTIYVRTGSIIKGGTDSKIAMELYDKRGEVAAIWDLEAWGGLMRSGHNYFERGNLDIFSGRGRCLSGPVCAIRIRSDGSGAHAGWYCNYVEVTSTGAHARCSQEKFTVEQWLALDAPPYDLTAIRNYCDSDGVRSAVPAPEASVRSVE